MSQDPSIHPELCTDAELEALLKWMADGARPEFDRIFRAWKLGLGKDERRKIVAAVQAEADRRVGTPGGRYPADEG